MGAFLDNKQLFRVTYKKIISCHFPFYPVPDYLPRGGVAGGRVSGQYAAAQGRQGESCRHPSGFHRQRAVILVHSIFRLHFCIKFSLCAKH
jgi:hypothetical protein